MELKPGYKQSDLGVIPEDWEARRLRDVISALLAGVSVNSTAEDVGQGVPSILKTSCVESGTFVPDEAKAIAPKDRKRATLNPRRGSILISRMNTIDLVGECGFVDQDYPQHFIPDRLWMTQFHSSSSVSSRWLAYLLSSAAYRRKLQLIASGTSGSMKNIAKSSLLALQIVYPPPAEQHAITNALSDVDALITKLDQLIAKKRDIKRGAMQQLLTGKTRLPGFSGEWEVKRLGDITSLIRGGVYGEERPRPSLVAARVATTAHIEMDDTWNDKEMGIRYFSREQIQHYSPIEGDLVVVKSSGSAASIQSGKIGYVSREEAGQFVFSNFLMLLRPLKGVPRFFYFYLSSHNVKKLIPSLVEASTYPNIRIPEYLEIEIPVPPEAEQTAIANVFSDMDAELADLEARRDKTYAIKQGMMQELLTGRIRLPVNPEPSEAVT